MDSDEIIAKHARGQLSGFKYKTYACFLPYCGAVRIFSKSEEFIRQDNNFIEYFLKDPVNLSFVRPIVSCNHECFHMFHILGSPIGQLIHFCSTHQIHRTYKFANDSLGSEEYLKAFRENKKYFLKHVEPCIVVNNLQYIRNLLGDQTEDLQSLKINDYSGKLITLLNSFKIILSKENKVLNHNIIFRLYEEMIIFGNVEKDSFFMGLEYHLRNKDSHATISNYIENIHSIIIPAISIIEGYARICEFIWENTIIFMYGAKNKHDDWVNTINSSNGRNSNLLKGYDCYAINFITSIFQQYIKSFVDWFNVSYISMFIFELTLCIPLNPFAFEKEKEICLFEIILNRRFFEITLFLARNHEKYYNEIISCYINKDGKKLIEIFDNFCTDIGFVTYSKCLEYSIMFNDSVDWGETYFKELSSNIIRIKLEGGLTAYDMTIKTFFIEQLKAIFILDDECFCTNKNFLEQKYFSYLINFIIREIFTQCLIFYKNDKFYESLIDIVPASLLPKEKFNQEDVIFSRL